MRPADPAIITRTIRNKSHALHSKLATQRLWDISVGPYIDLQSSQYLPRCWSVKHGNQHVIVQEITLYCLSVASCLLRCLGHMELSQDRQGHSSQSYHLVEQRRLLVGLRSHLWSSNSHEGLALQGQGLSLGQLPRQAPSHSSNRPDALILDLIASLLADLVHIRITNPYSICALSFSLPTLACHRSRRSAL